MDKLKTKPSKIDFNKLFLDPANQLSEEEMNEGVFTLDELYKLNGGLPFKAKKIKNTDGKGVEINLPKGVIRTFEYHGRSERILGFVSEEESNVTICKETRAWQFVD